jgi:hypothetical protein
MMEEMMNLFSILMKKNWTLSAHDIAGKLNVFPVGIRFS